eukprot:7390071-Prymnesium_polylepis.2
MIFSRATSFSDFCFCSRLIRLVHARLRRVGAGVRRHFQRQQLHAALFVEGGIGRGGGGDERVERRHKLLERHARHRLDERRARVVPDVTLGVAGALDHPGHVVDLPEDVALEQQLDVVGGAHRVLEEGVLRAQVDLRHAHLAARRAARALLRHPLHCDEARVRRQEEGGARARAVRVVAAVERVRALVVLHDHDLVRLDADQLPHLHDLLMRAREEAAALRDEARLARLAGENERRGVVVDVDGVGDRLLDALGDGGEEQLLAALDAHAARRRVHQLDVLVREQLQRREDARRRRVARDHLLRRLRHPRGGALDERNLT